MRIIFHTRDIWFKNFKSKFEIKCKITIPELTYTHVSPVPVFRLSIVYLRCRPIIRNGKILLALKALKVLLSESNIEKNHTSKWSKILSSWLNFNYNSSGFRTEGIILWNYAKLCIFQINVNETTSTIPKINENLQVVFRHWKISQ